ncbi:hypothetical protein ACFOET_18960 [Parapedobacter deserti]|uniref:Uncharacterized protein n=1 Tax=Parapedobacter deserti TaxID=1912957 RepID=A0ABV7JSF8_9SPHI
MNDRDLARATAAGIMGTSTMTFFSYLASSAVGDNFREPVLLDGLIRGTLLPARSRIARPAGWALHYAMGCSLANLFHYSWKRSHTKPTLLRALLYGGCSGLAAIAWWHTAFRLHPNPPHVRMPFYIQLVAAHLIYSMSVARVCSASVQSSIKTRRHEKK